MSKKRGLNTQVIMNAAAQLAEEKGLENISLLQVADKLGVKSPSLYNYLSGVKELSEGIAKIAFDKLEDTMRNAAVGKSKEDALMAIAVAYRKYAKENPELYKAILRFYAYTDSNLQAAGYSTINVVYKVMEPYNFSREENVHFIRGFRGALHGFVSLEEAGFLQGPEADVDESFEKLVSRLISTLNTTGEM